MKKLLGFLLGAGAGVVGTLIRTAVATIAGIFLAKGYIDEATSNQLVEQVVGIALTILAVIGSWLNNEKAK